jgi:hypothetical protein
VVGVFLLCSPTLAQSTSVVARASAVTGRALLFNTNAAVPIALTPGYILTPGDRVDTRGGGRVVIELSDGSMVVVSPESVVTLKDFRAASSLRELFEISVGLVRVKINHFGGKPNPYRMNSPTASIAVRGTEFTIDVDASGATQVTVIEGAVEVTSLADPARSVLLQAGQSFRMIAGNLLPPPNRDGERHGEPPPPPNNLAQAKGPDPHVDGPPPQQVGKAGMPPSHNDHDSDEGSPRGNAGTYNRYLANLIDIGQVPFLLRYIAFAEPHLDALENPAYATTFRSLEGRVYFLPTFHGSQALAENQSTFGPGGALPSDYSVSPQISLFAPAHGFTLGGSASFSRVGASQTGIAGAVSDQWMTPRDPYSAPKTSSTSTSDNFYSGSLVAARQLGGNSFGLELSTLKGTGSFSTDVTQTRLTAGYARDLARSARLGVYYRYGFIDSRDRDPQSGSTATTGHSSELGIRLRGQITPRLYYGVAGSWLGISLLDGLVRSYTTDSHERDRANRGSGGVGLGYLLSRRTILTFDLAGGASHNSAARHEDSTGRLLQDSGANNRFVSMHGAVQHDLTRRLFLSASFLQVWQSGRLNVSVFPDRYGNAVAVSDSFFSLSPGVSLATRFSDYGAGWRFTPDLWVQYIYSTDYGVSGATHSLMLRYTFGRGR